MQDEARNKRQQLIWLGLILLTAIFLRLWQIGDLPPGITHDEADHGITAWSIVNGARGIYFTVGYGREPLFDYATAILMRWLGPTYLAGRLTAVFFSLFSLIFLYLWAKKAFDSFTALLTTAGLAVSFWGVMSGRQSLRSITLGAFFVSGLWLYFTAIKNSCRPSKNRATPWLNTTRFLASGLLLGLAFYTYIPARALWLVLPGCCLYLLFFDSHHWRHVAGGTAATLLLALGIGTPLFSYLNANPTVEVRIQELRAPLTAVRQGNLLPLWQNIRDSLRLFFIEGDTAWRYNLAGKPWLSPWMAALFLIGLGFVSWWAIRPFYKKGWPTLWYGFSSWTVLLWLGIGLAPVLVTGPELSSTQAMGMQPVLYLLPAIGLARILMAIHKAKGLAAASQWQAIIPVTLFGLSAIFTWRDYLRWGAHPEVRVQYESTMVAAMDYLNERGAETAVSISTITPGQFHTPALAKMWLTVDTEPRWFNASNSLLIPNRPTSLIILPGFTPLHTGLADYFETAVLQTTLPLQESDIDRPLDIFAVDLDKMMADWETDFEAVLGSISLGDNLQLIGYDVNERDIRVGNQLQIATLWQIIKPVAAEAKLYTHMTAEHSAVIGQDDRLGAPAESWQAGDWLIQLHVIDVTEEMIGVHPLKIGGYFCQENCKTVQSWPIFYDDAAYSETAQPIGTVEVFP